MKWNDTVASSCRYGEIAGRIFKGAEILWENSDCDYQGHANVLAILPNGDLCHYEWTYGSCAGCDSWEAYDLTEDQIEAEMRRDAVFISDMKIMIKYLQHVTKDYQSIEDGLREHWRKHEDKNQNNI